MQSKNPNFCRVPELKPLISSGAFSPYFVEHDIFAQERGDVDELCASEQGTPLVPHYLCLNIILFV